MEQAKIVKQSPIFIKWWWFVLLPAAAPIGADYLAMFMYPEKTLDILDPISRGQLYLVSAGLVAATIGDAIENGNPRKRLSLIGFNAALLVVSVFAYGVMCMGIRSHRAVGEAPLFPIYLSIINFGFSVLAAMSSIILRILPRKRNGFSLS